MTALDVISAEFSREPLSVSTAAHPFLHSRLTELQVHTLMGLDFSSHEVWTRKEIRAAIGDASEALNKTAAMVYPYRLAEDFFFNLREFVFRPKGATE